MASSNVENNLKQEHNKPEDLHGSNNNLTPLTHTNETTSSTTVGTTKGTKPTWKKIKRCPQNIPPIRRIRWSSSTVFPITYCNICYGNSIY
ncbi:hypothetical protein L5515_001647 [Caenorhabditis briggsae]|uniref:Uncharacterized protein n=1 Tax=Caenorhabditis briggsae TaxID=6238 RepID=A0AAE9E5T6_CAEBR|nr:hypothetical protein L3Y34_015568 [Caenorhabditis briggsae]UMM13289.1 hypothetical protein L5515_001647 [Caenorhabditis briggsae]